MELPCRPSCPIIKWASYLIPIPYPIQIIVIDTGPGIHYHQQERIFLLDTSTRRTGHGLGLYISRNLAETMGGRLRLVDSLMFIGSAFVVELPQS
jgi:signal transduction histidine kinase